MTLKEIEPYLTLVTAFLSVGALGFILNLWKAMRDSADDRIKAVTESSAAELRAAQERSNILEERIKLHDEDKKRAEDWYDRQKTDLTEQLNRAKQELDALLKGNGVDLYSLTIGRQLSDQANLARDSVEKLVREMQEKIDRLSDLESGNRLTIDPAWELSLAMGAMSYGSFAEAAAHFEAYSKEGELTWQDSLTRGVAHANARGGRETDLASLRAYNDAVALLPDDLETNKKARIFGYRGAIFKRLGRTSEAEADLKLALKFAHSEREIFDIHYNLACIYAMRRDKQAMLSEMEYISGSPRYIGAVIDHKEDYFSYYANDPDFQVLLQA